MKNSYQEHIKRLAKLNHRHQRGKNYINGMLIRHLYPAEKATQLSGWDDVSFILNDYRVNVAWIHPRQDYLDHLQSEASKRVAHLSPIGDIFNKSTANYVKVGQSRKKVVSHTMSFTKESELWSKAYDLALQEVSETTQYCATPFIRKEWLANGYFVNLCAPIEVRSIHDLTILVSLVKRLLKRETTLEQEFPHYTYTKEQWVAEESSLNKMPKSQC
ncbi:MAG: hypothetical protein HOP06_06500 [Methylotenera sp.]|nr:hypothetical protein [Methylotenera sp.]